MRAVFFDIGSTLITGPDKGVAKRLALQLGLSEAEKQTLNAALMTRRFETPQAAARFACEGLGIVAPGLDVAVEEIWNAQINEACALDGALESLRAWADAGADLCFISNIWRPYQLSALAALGPDLDQLVPHAQRFYSFELGAAKPSAAPFEAALAAVRCTPGEAIMVGDSYNEDIAPALSLGLGAAWVLCRPEKEADNIARIERGEAAAPDLTVRAIGEFTPKRWRDESAAIAKSYATG